MEWRAKLIKLRRCHCWRKNLWNKRKPLHTNVKPKRTKRKTHKATEKSACSLTGNNASDWLNPFSRTGRGEPLTDSPGGDRRSQVRSYKKGCHDAFLFSICNHVLGFLCRHLIQGRYFLFFYPAARVAWIGWELGKNVTARISSLGRLAAR